MDIQVEYPHDEREQYRQQCIGKQAVLQHPSHDMGFPPSEQASYDRGQPVRESGSENNGQGKHVVDKTGGGQLVRTVMAYHQCIGKTQNDDAYLADYDGEA